MIRWQAGLEVGLQWLDAILPPPDGAVVRLVVFHYHDRPGGVRQVMMRGLPQLVERLGGVKEVVLLLGEVTDPGWVRELEAKLAGKALRVVWHRELGYLSGGPQEIGSAAQALVLRELSGKEVLVWAHNLSVGRNLPLLRQLPEWCAAAGARLWLHHHDWWWDGRWARWADWQAFGVTDLEEALELSVPTGPHLRHWCVNLADLPWLQLGAGDAAQWVGNPLPEIAVPDKSQIAEATAWLRFLTQGRRVWLAPVRALRRKNLAEAIFLAQHEDEPSCLVTTGGPSSPAEASAWQSLALTATRHHWPFVPAVLAPGARGGHPSRPNDFCGIPSLAALLTAADTIVMPSLQEGFGLPYLEAAALEKPLLARGLPEVSANLAALGCKLAGPYHQVTVMPGSFNKVNECVRLAARWATLRSGLPRELEAEADPPQPDDVMDFGCLSLEAQLEVLQSNAGPALPVPEAQVPQWPAQSREDGWVDRFFQRVPQQGQPLADLGGTNVRPLCGFLLPEVVRRFRYFQQHPLLWP